MVVSVVTLVGLLNGYGVVHLPTVPGKRALQTRVDRLTDGYTRRVGCSAGQVRALSTPGEPSDAQLRAVERYCDGVPGARPPSGRSS
jgi:hypothetical protein